MARHDLYPYPGNPGYLLDVQTDLLDGLNTRIVVPVLAEGVAPTPARLLNPGFDIEGERHYLMTQFMASVPAASLRSPVANLSDRSDDVTRALDMIFQGY